MTADPQSKTTYKYTPYLAYAPSGTVEGELVYANMGHLKDFMELAKRNISVKGKIVIMGSLFANIKNAEKYGAIGAILYPDPKEYAAEGHEFNDTYPNTPWMPPDAVQTVSQAPSYGDALTPLLPATKGMYRVPLNQTELLSIPAQAISYRDGKYIMSRMGGEKVPDYWKGNFKIDYRVGPGFEKNASNTTSIVRLEVNNQLITKKIRNVIATIRGSQEPDRYVLIGNHKDAWTFGGSDPSSGTATLIEISRVLSDLLRQGWKPKRTIKLCSWGGEELALLGSYEWVQENDEILRKRAVVYLNTDVAVGGDFVFFVQSSPMLGDLIIKHVKQIKDPGNSSKTIYDTMLERLPKSNDYPGEPNLFTFLFSTDNIPFLLYSGLTTADFSYFYGYKNQYKLYPLYHTQYDNFEWIKKFVDPKFLYFKAMAQFLGSMLLDLSDSDILPFSIPRFSKSVQKACDNFDWPYYKDKLDQSQLSQLKIAKDEFVNMTEAFESAKQKLRDQQPSPLTLRMLNDQIAGVEKSFVGTYSNTSRKPERMILFHDTFQNVDDVVQQQSIDERERDVRLKFELSLVIRCLRVATKLIKPL